MMIRWGYSKGWRQPWRQLHVGKLRFFDQSIELSSQMLYRRNLCACRDIGLAHRLARWQSATTQSLTKFDRREFIDNAERLSL